MSDNPRLHSRLLEAILFAAGEPLTERQLAERLPAGADIPSRLRDLTAAYADRGVCLVKAGNSWAFATAMDLAPLLRRPQAAERQLSQAAVETLAIIAYHQPVTRGEIEQIRGVQVSRGTIDLLLQKTWIAPGGRREAPGRPMLWRTTDRFLHHFGMATLKDLPNLDELRLAGLLEAPPAAEPLLPGIDHQHDEA